MFRAGRTLHGLLRALATLFPAKGPGDRDPKADEPTGVPDKFLDLKVGPVIGPDEDDE